MIKPNFESLIDLTFTSLFRDLPSPESDLRDLSPIVECDIRERHRDWMIVFFLQMK
jgi:hypothetical protein